MRNTEYFTLLAGNPAAWDAEYNSLPPRNDNALCRLQSAQAARGRLSATLWENIYGWAVGYDSNLQGRSVIRGGRAEKGMTKEAAIEAGIEWANKDPENREFYVRKTDLKGA